MVMVLFMVELNGKKEGSSFILVTMYEKAIIGEAISWLKLSKKANR